MGICVGLGRVWVVWGSEELCGFGYSLGGMGQ